MKACFDIRCQYLNAGLVDELQDRLGIHERYACLAIRQCANDHIAGKQQTDFWLSADRLVRE